MGLFSFIKEAGAKLLSDDDKKVQEKSQEEKDKALADNIVQVVGIYKLSVENLNVEINGENAVVSGTVPDQATRERLILIVGNTAGIASVDDQIEVVELEPEAQFYTVKKGDYLSKIAKEVYGDAMKYKIIFEANKPMLKDPDLIYPGQVLRIPPLD